MTYANMRANEIVAYAFNGSVGQIAVQMNDCPLLKAEELIETLRARFGKPAAEKALSASGHVAEWNDGSSRVTYLWLSSGRASTCSVTYQSKPHLSELNKRQEAAAKARGTGM